MTPGHKTCRLLLKRWLTIFRVLPNNIILLCRLSKSTKLCFWRRKSSYVVPIYTNNTLFVTLTEKIPSNITILILCWKVSNQLIPGSVCSIKWRRVYQTTTMPILHDRNLCLDIRQAYLSSKNISIVKSIEKTTQQLWEWALNSQHWYCWWSWRWRTRPARWGSCRCTPPSPGPLSSDPRTDGTSPGQTE